MDERITSVRASVVQPVAISPSSSYAVFLQPGCNATLRSGEWAGVVDGMVYCLDCLLETRTAFKTGGLLSVGRGRCGAELNEPN